ncbi:MAG: Nif3-like dinuclear metal center hexameric protein [Bdellovibrionales bacterium]|nr:Nif3-like dinuclear metal center hexameric protein [Bdellovibrionales bacterium]
MTIGEVGRLLYERIPVEDAWTQGEPYGWIGTPDGLAGPVNKVVYCVTSPNQEGVRFFRESGFDLLVAHHPINLNPHLPTMVFHTALDCCRGGLNDQWRDILQIKNARHFDKNLGWYGKIEPLTLGQLVGRIEAALGDEIQGQTFGPKNEFIKSVAVCSGLGGLVNSLALKTRADCYIVGEAAGVAAKAGFKFYIEIGHTLSERMGVNVVREVLTPHGIQVDLMPIEFESWPAETFGNRKSND